MKRAVRAMLIASVAILTATASAVAESGGRVRAMVELFTSQGCSSCPAADALLGEIRARDDILALSLPVDYWDYLGWKDTLAKPEFSKRQRDYARVRGDGNVYTPQIVINGRIHAAGNKKRAIEAAVSEAELKASDFIPLSAVTNGKQLTVKVGAADGAAKFRNGTIWLATVLKSVPVAIRFGENRGRTLTYYNVVRTLAPVGTWNGTEIEISLPHDDTMADGDQCAVFIQHGHAGAIVSAAWLKGAAQ